MNPSQQSPITYSPISNVQSMQNLSQLQNPQQLSQSSNEPFITRLFPTLGSLGGLALGTALAPETGGLSLLASIAGAGLGQAAGKAAENVSTGQDVTSGLLSNLASGASSGLIGAGLGGLVGKTGEALTGLGAKAAEKTAQTAATTAAADMASNEAERVGLEFAGVKPGYANVGDALTQARNLGIANPTAEDLDKLSKVYTGSNPETGTGVLNFVKNNALDQAGGTVNLDNSMNSLHEYLSSPEAQALGGESPVTSARGELPMTPSTPATKISQQFRNMLPAGKLNSEGQIVSELSPTEGQDLLSKIGDQIDITTPKKNALGIIDPIDQAENNAWRTIYRSVSKSVYNRPEVDAAVSATRVTPDLEAAIDDAIKSNGFTDPQIAANIKSDIINRINGSQTAQDILDAERPMVNVGKAGKSAIQDFQDNPQLPRNVRLAKYKAGQQVEPIAPAPPTAEAASEVASHLLGGRKLAAVGALVKRAATPKNIQATGGLLSKIAPAIQPTAVAAGTLGGLGAGPTTNVQSIAGSAMNPTNPIEQLFNANTAQNILAPGPYGASSSNLLSTLLPQAQKAQMAQSLISNLEQSFAGAGGAQGFGGGLLSRLSALVPGTAAHAYQGQVSATAAQLASLLGISTDQAAALLPQLMQSQGTAGQRIGGLQSVLGGLPGTSTSLNSVK